MRKESFIAIGIVSALCASAALAAPKEVKLPPIPDHPLVCHIGANPVNPDRGYDPKIEFLVSVSSYTLIPTIDHDGKITWCNLQPGDTVVARLEDGLWIRVYKCGNDMYGPPHHSPIPVPPVTHESSGPKRALLQVVKIVINHGGNKTDKDALLYVDRLTKVYSGEINAFEPGPHVVSEVMWPNPYVARFSGDCDADGAVTLVAGETKRCTITNEEGEPRKIRVLTSVKKLEQVRGFLGPVIGHETTPGTPFVDREGLGGGIITRLGIFQTDLLLRHKPKRSDTVTIPACWESQAKGLPMDWPCLTATFNRSGEDGGTELKVQFAWRYLFQSGWFLGPTVGLHEGGLGGGVITHAGIFQGDLLSTHVPGQAGFTQSVDVCWYGGTQCKTFTHDWEATPSTHEVAVQFAWRYVF